MVLVVNVWLNFVELIVIQTMIYYFLSCLPRNIHRPKWCYLVVFFLHSMTFCYVIYRWGNAGAGALITVAGCILACYFLFTTDQIQMFYSCVYVTVLILCQGIVIYGLGSIYARLGLFITYREANVMILLKIVAEIFVTKCFVWISRKRRESSLTKFQYIVFLIVPVFSIVYFYSICVFSGIYVQLYGMELVVFNIVLLLVMNGCMTYLLAKILKTNSLQNELNLANQKEEMQCRYYEEIEQKYQESRKIIHDMRNHLLVIEQLQSSGEEERAREYIGDVHQMLNMFGHKYYTDNRLLNIILNDKEKAANRASVTFDARIGAIALEGMKDSDLTTVFANLLDNAVEAAKESEQKQVVIRADSIHEFNVIRIENTMSFCQKRKEGHMGIGLENVTRVLKKYDGSFQRERMDGKYVCIVTMPKFPGMTEKAEFNEKRKWI